MTINQPSKRKIGVLVIDDSAVVRQTLTEIINSSSDLYVMDTAADPYIAVEKIRQQTPDVITLDIEMPRMDGITFLKKIMKQHPLPVVICSSLATANSDTTLNALELGAIEIIQKPTLGTKRFLEEASLLITDAIRAAAKSKPQPRTLQKKPVAKLNADTMLSLQHSKSSKAMAATTEKIIAVGASTGGTEAIRQLLEAMPLDCPAIAVVQHMPEGFTKSFAERLNRLCTINVKEAVDGDHLLRGHALIAPGNKHMLIKRSGALYYVEVKDGPLVSRHRPSVDVLFRSAARYAGANALGTILTGMGDDGANGMLEMHNAGSWTVAQNEETCVVYGMPKEAVKRNAVDRELPLLEIAGNLIRKSKEI
jgi:two-component system chemotaxis response regulator CheB